MFPWRKHTNEELMHEFEKLKTKISKQIKFPILFSTIGFKCTNIFFQYERMNTEGINKPSTIQYWEKNKDNVIKFSKRVNRDIFSTLNYFNHSPSQFPIVTASLLYKHFKAKKVLDPYSGWGDRCLAAMAVGINYIGIDSNEALKEPYNKLIEFYYSYGVNSYQFINSKCENVDLQELDYDFVFTSPPFWRNGKMIEKYRNVEVPYKVFMENSLIPIFHKIKLEKKAKMICLYIPTGMYNELSTIYGPADLMLEFKTTNTKISILFCWRL